MAMAAKQGLVSRSVASCFLFKFSASTKPQVALFRRSTKVRTYQQRLAPISGSIEESDRSPIAAVWREINEETTLTPGNLSLFRQGKPYSFTDEKVGRVWTVHPFAFSLKSDADEKKIKLDWEHDGFSWHDPMEVTDEGSFEGVPFLAKSLRRVWFEMDLGEARAQILRRGLETLQNDRASGARQLASKALEIFRLIVTEVQGETVETWRSNAQFAAWHLWKNGRESMGAAVLNTLVRGLMLMDEEVSRIEGDTVTQEFLVRVSKHLLHLQQQRETSPERTWQSLRPMLTDLARNSSEPIKIVTLSASSTVAWCLQQALQLEGLSLDIRILESRPLFEGASMAAKLGESLPDGSSAGDSKITVYSDASAAVASKGADILLLGADLIAGDGSISNKVGSLPAVLSAKFVSPKIKVIVLAELEKMLPVPAPAEDEENDTSELTKAWGLDTVPGQAAEATHGTADALPKTLAAKNVYFEWVPADLVDVYVSEDTSRSTQDIIRQVDSSRAEVERLFAEEETAV